MFPAGVRHEATAADEGGSVMERWQTGEGRSQEIASSPQSSPTALLRTRSPLLAPRAHAFSAFGSQNYPPITLDRTDQVAPPGAKIRLTASFWEDEGSLCFQVEARGVCVARREDNHMINGTKLLSVAGIDRGRRDGILKSEKTRHVVKTGPMHLKGVWIPFERALALADREKITELLYPLFVHDIKQLLYDPKNQKRTYLANPQHKSQETKEPAEPIESHVRQIDVPEDGDKTSQEIPLDTLRNDELQEQGPIGSLSRSLIETLSLILIEVRTHSDRALHYGSLESSCAALFFWDADLGLSRGELDDMLQDSPQLRDTCLTVLVSISQFVSISLIHLISSEQRRKEVLQSTSILTCLDQTVNMIEQQYHSTDKPEQDAETLCQTLRTRIDTLIMLAPSLESPAEETFDDEEPRAIQYMEKNLPEQAYINSVSEKFPLAASEIVAQLGKLNWDRYNHMIHLQRETMQQEFQMATMEKARTIFNDSGLGISLPAQSKAASSSESIYAPSIVSTRAEASHKRVPLLPPQARSGEPFTCEICNKQVKFQRTKAWKKHVFRDILAYACFFAECCNTRMFFEDSDALMTHLQDQHGMDVRLSDVECPLCMEFTSGDRDVLALHIARHMEEITLAILPSGVESDEESADESGSVIGSNDSSESSGRVIQSVEEKEMAEQARRDAELATFSRLEKFLIDRQKAKLEKQKAKKEAAKKAAKEAEEAKKRLDKDKLAKSEQLILAQRDEQLKREATADAEAARITEEKRQAAEKAKIILEASEKLREEVEKKAAAEDDENKKAYGKALAEAIAAVEDKLAKLEQPPAHASIDSTSVHYDPSIPVHDGTPYYQSGHTIQLEDSQLPPLKMRERTPPLPPPQYRPLGLNPQDNIETSDEQRTKFQDISYSDEDRLSFLSAIESMRSAGLIPPKSEPEDNSETSSKQQTRPGGTIAYPEALRLFLDPQNPFEEQSRQLESEPQDNSGGSSVQQKVSQDTPKRRSASPNILNPDSEFPRFDSAHNLIVSSPPPGFWEQDEPC